MLVRLSMTSTISPSGRPRRSVPDDARENAVAVQHLTHLVFRQDQVLSAVVADQEAEAIAMALDLTGDQIGARGDQQQSGPVTDDAPGALELFQFS